MATETVVLVIESADQQLAETNASHEAPPLEATVLMQHILLIYGAVTWIHFCLSECGKRSNPSIKSDRSLIVVDSMVLVQVRASLLIIPVAAGMLIVAPV